MNIRLIFLQVARLFEALFIDEQLYTLFWILVVLVWIHIFWTVTSIHLDTFTHILVFSYFLLFQIRYFFLVSFTILSFETKCDEPASFEEESIKEESNLSTYEEQKCQRHQYRQDNHYEWPLLFLTDCAEVELCNLLI